jgi:TRAP-type C4-dicarboxylate transport system permease large subunit
MWEVYLISRLDGIVAASWIIFGSLLVAFIIFTGVYITMDSEYMNDDEQIAFRHVKTCWKICLGVLIPCFFIGLFVPNKNDALAIMGVGTVVDYVQENKTLQEMPDKCVQALDIWLDDKLNIQNDTIK